MAEVRSHTHTYTQNTQSDQPALMFNKKEGGERAAKRILGVYISVYLCVYVCLCSSLCVGVMLGLGV